MKRKALLIRITDDKYKALKTLANKEKWSLNQIGEEAVLFYLKARRALKSSNVDNKISE